MSTSHTRLAAAALLLTGSALTATAEGELNIYSSRHYDTDEQLYGEFEDATGITINRIEGNADELIARMKAEGPNSPADILIAVDTSRLHRAKEAGVLQAAESEILEDRIPAYLQDVDNQWFGFSQRSRVIYYDKNEVAEPPMTYADLADPKYKGQVCIRSSGNVYNQTLLAAIVTHEGEDAAKVWAEGVVANMARDPQGGDTDQIRGIVSGECEIAVGNTYYFARAMAQDVKGVSEQIDMIGWIFPDQDGNGAHMNLSGAGIAAHAPHKENAVKFLEYLASDSAQEYFAGGNNEFPAVEGIETTAAVQKLGEFKPDEIDLSEVAGNLDTAQKIFNEVGWK
ncbi:iron(III) transport system substrate-binding protein [Aliiruegeria haliotis]|uniref:Iron(III) transport system substrate-binding protein n=1 Tax=Aliiruegeria haliotis TaxID=1280846 RepID=A0A2T0RYX0_9RHOB|nr:Fe(3+) ABC transporter substrate-binding protein [Aliiruegeria haliotis]PRY26374.1 iron(III) transport system substrate-binding protein [Aliiruegeria haliotis]